MCGHHFFRKFLRAEGRNPEFLRRVSSPPHEACRYEKTTQNNRQRNTAKRNNNNSLFTVHWKYKSRHSTTTTHFFVKLKELYKYNNTRIRWFHLVFHLKWTLPLYCGISSFRYSYYRDALHWLWFISLYLSRYLLSPWKSYWISLTPDKHQFPRLTSYPRTQQSFIVPLGYLHVQTVGFIYDADFSQANIQVIYSHSNLHRIAGVVLVASYFVLFLSLISGDHIKILA